MLPLLLMYIPYVQGFINFKRESDVYVFCMIVQVPVYDKIISKAYERNDQFSQKNCNRTSSPIHFPWYLSVITYSKMLQLWGSTFIVILQNNISMTMTILEDTLRHLLRVKGKNEPIWKKKMVMVVWCLEAGVEEPSWFWLNHFWLVFHRGSR